MKGGDGRGDESIPRKGEEMNSIESERRDGGRVD